MDLFTPDANACTEDDPTDCGLSPPAPAHPALEPAPHGIAAIRAYYGDIKIAGGKVVAPPHWESENMVLVHDLPGVGHKLYVHRKIAQPLRALLEVFERHGYPIRTIGCFNPRPKRVNGDPSAHSWGAAVDINADTNPMTLKAQPLITDLPAAMVAEGEALGWTWGGHFHDPMHWQWLSGY